MTRVVRKPKRVELIVVALLALGLVSTAATEAKAQVPSQLAQQGRLFDSLGAPVDNSLSRSPSTTTNTAPLRCGPKRRRSR